MWNSGTLNISGQVLKMDVDKLWDKVTKLFNSGDELPYSDAATIQAAERDMNDPGVTDKKEAAARLAWAFVHSKSSDDVKRGIAMLQVQLSDPSRTSVQEREVLYMLAVGHYRSSDLRQASDYCDRALKTSPDFRQASNLKRLIEDRIRQDGAIGIGIAATATALVVGGLVALTAKRH